MNAKKQWMVSGGGPSIIIAEKDRTKWSGTSTVTANKEGRFEEAKDILSATECHYGLACSKFTAISPISIEDDTLPVIVIGEEPLSMDIVTSEESDAFYIVKEQYAETEEEYFEFIKFDNLQTDAELQDEWERNFEIEFSETNLVLMDAAIWGAKELDENKKDNAPFTIKSGKYQVSTAEYEPDDEYSMIVHKFEKI